MTDKNGERLDFAGQQAAMTEGWYENTKRLHGDVEPHIATRHSMSQY
jgi:hypothetical protein